MRRNASVLSMVSMFVLVSLTNGCTPRLWKPITMDAPVYPARQAWNLRKDMPVVIVRTNGDSLSGMFQHVVSLNNPRVHYTMQKGVVSDSMQIESVGIELETTKRSEVVPLEEVQSIVIPTGYEECGYGEIGCLSLRWDELRWVSPCPSLSELLSSDMTGAGFPAGKRYWPGETVEEVNERAAKSKASVVLTGERVRKVKNLVLAPDSSSWLDPKSKTLVRVASEEILAIRFTDHGEGAKLGVLEGFDVGLDVRLKWDREQGLAVTRDGKYGAGVDGDVGLAPPAVIFLAVLGGVIGGASGVTTSHEPLLPCPQSL